MMMEELWASCPRCFEKETRIRELEVERDRWYGKSIERAIKINQLVSTVLDTMGVVEPKGIQLAAFRELRAMIEKVK